MARLPRGRRIRAVVLVLTVVVVVAAATAGPVFLDRDRELEETPEYAIGALVPERAPADGEVVVQPRDEPGVVLIDTAHRNRLSQAEIKPLLQAITDAGYEIDLLEGRDDFDRSLTRADAFVVVDPSEGYDDDEVNRVEDFVERGGRLLLIGEPTTLELAGFALLQRVNRLTPLSSRFGFEFGEAHLYNMHEFDGNHLNIYAEPAANQPLTRGVSRAALYTSTRISVREGEPLLVAGDQTRSSRTDATGTYAVAAVNGNVVAIADGTFLRRGNFNVVDNEQLVRNVVRFLVSGEKQRPLGAYPTFVSDEPTIRYTGPALIDAAQDLSADLRASGREPTVTLRRNAVSPNETDILVTTYDYLDRHGQLSTGVRVSDGHVALNGYSSSTQGIIVVRAPARNYDLVVVADTPARAQRAVDRLVDGTLGDHLITERTAVIRTAGAADPVDESEETS